MKKACDKLLNYLENDLGYLRVEEGFKIIEQRSERSDFCLIFLESDKFRIKTFLGPDYAALHFGTLDAPLTWEDKSNEDIEWYSIHLLVSFFEADTEIRILSEEEWRSKTIDYQLREIAELMTRYMPAIKDMFGKGKSIEGRKNLETHIKLRQDAARIQYEQLIQKNRDG